MRKTSAKGSEMNHIWIVEMWNPIRDRFEPTVGAALTKSDCAYVRHDWMARNPGDRFRIRHYDAKAATKGKRK